MLSYFRHLVLFSGVIFIIAAISVKMVSECDSNLQSNQHFFLILGITLCFPGKLPAFVTSLICRNTATTQRCLPAFHYKFSMKRYKKRPHKVLAQKSICYRTESQNGQVERDHSGSPGSTRVILEFIAQDCVNPC